MDQGIRGFDPEPRRGYRSALTRDAHLQAFSDAVWQRHEATHARGGLLGSWPNRATFKANWPGLAEDLLVADWKVAGALALVEVSEISLELLDPSSPPARDWREVYGLELASQPELVVELSRPGRGDGIELVLERAQLTSGERAVMREWLYGKDVGAIAEDLRWRPQLVGTLLRNGLDRLRWLGQADLRKRGNVRGQRSSAALAGRAGNGHVPVAAAAGNGTHPPSRSRRGSGPGRVRRLSGETASSALGPPAHALDAQRAL